MKINDLPSPGQLSNGIKLRVEAAKAISAAQVSAMRTPGGQVAIAGVLAKFFSAASSALTGLYEVVLPTVTARTVVSATQVNLVFSEQMDTTVLPTAAAFASAGNTITDIAWVNGTTLNLIGTGFAAAELLSYTAPTLNAIRDRSGNLLASFTNQALA